MFIQTINPSTETALAKYPLLNEMQINELIQAAHISFSRWSQTTFEYRRERMMRLAECLLNKQSEFALLMANEMGKPLAAGIMEIKKCAWVCEHYAQYAESYLATKMIQTELSKSQVCYRPLGVIFAIMPWNFPFWQVFRFAAPTIMAGNTAILKHAPISSGTGNAIANLFLEAEFPEHLFQHFIINNELAKTVIAHEHIKALTLTGSERAGREVGALAGQNLKKVVLELGGNDPYLVLKDADIDNAAFCIVTSRLANTGQVCIAAKRIIAVKEIYDELLQKIKIRVADYKVGDPLDPTTMMGPMARDDLRNTLHQQILKSIAQGSTLEMGGVIPKGKGFFYPATILTNVKPKMVAFDEELFGPVLSFTKADNEKHAIALANESRFGLGSAIFTKDLVRAEQIALNEIETGSCFINTFVSSDPRLPFGGIKYSGYGRELAQEGILSFTNTKTVGIAK